MKNKFKLFLLTILLIPFVVKADMGGPSLKPYQMVVINPNGIDCHDYQGTFVAHLNKDDTFMVDFEMKEEYSITFNNNNCTLKTLDGASLVKDELDPEEAAKEENVWPNVKKIASNNSAVIYGEDGVDIKKGPANAYETIGHIAKGEKITYLYYLNGGDGITHVYVNYNGTNGWVEILGGKVYIENNYQYIAMKDLDMGCATISKNTIITPIYKSDNWTRKVVVKKDSCEYIYNKLGEGRELIQIFELENRQVRAATTEIGLYEYPDNEGEKYTTIPVDGEITILTYEDARYTDSESYNFYVEYEGKRGWIKSNYNELKATDTPVKPSEIDEKPSSTETTDTTTIGAEKTNPKDYVLSIVIICLVVVLTAIVIITLVNKKRKKKEE